MTLVDSLMSQGNHAMRSDISRITFGPNAGGIIVSALSDSFKCFFRAAVDQSSSGLGVGDTDQQNSRSAI